MIKTNIKFILVLSALFLGFSGGLLAQKGLNPATKSVLSSINGSIEIKFYLSSSLPDSMSKLDDQIKSLLKDHIKESDNKIKYSIIDPDRATKREYHYFQENFEGIRVVDESDNLFKYKTAYSGAVLYYGSKIIILPLLLPSSSLEYDLTVSMKKLLVTEKTKVGVIFGHGEPTLASLKPFLKTDIDLIDYSEVILKKEKDIHQYKALLLVAPIELIEEKELDILDDYLDKGGNMLVALDRVIVNNSTKMGTSLITGMGQWLNEKGISIKKEFVIDENCGLIMVTQGTFQMPVSLPYLPSIENYTTHPVTSGLNRIVFRFPSPVEFVGDQSLKYTPLFSSSNRSNSFISPLYIDYNKLWSDSDFPKSSINIACALERQLSNKGTSKLLVIGDGDFLLDEDRNYTEDDDNLVLFFNAVEWLADDTGLVELKVVRNKK